MTDRNKVLSLMGLAARAGKIQSGGFATEKNVKAGRAFAVVVAGDASLNTQKQFRNMCAYYKVPFYVFSDKENLGKAIGKELRSCLAICDENLAGAVIRGLAEAGMNEDAEKACISGEL